MDSVGKGDENPAAERVGILVVLVPFNKGFFVNSGLSVYLNALRIRKIGEAQSCVVLSGHAVTDGS